MSDESIGKTLGIALVVCIACSILVSTAAVTLKSKQEHNKQVDKIKNILQAGALYEDGMDVVKTYEDKIEPVMIDLETGEQVSKDKFSEELSIETFEIKTISEHPEYSAEIPQDKDIAGLKRKPKYMVIYYVKTAGEIEKIILPIYGKGLWSTLYGFIALNKNLQTVEGLTYYEHGETPGLGGEVDNPRWKKSWTGKQAFDENNKLILTVLKGTVDPSKPDATHQIDGLAGATITTRGLDSMVKYWLQEQGYGSFLAKLRSGGTDEQI